MFICGGFPRRVYVVEYEHVFIFKTNKGKNFCLLFIFRTNKGENFCLFEADGDDAGDAPGFCDLFLA